VRGHLHGLFGGVGVIHDHVYQVEREDNDGRTYPPAYHGVNVHHTRSVNFELHAGYELPRARWCSCAPEVFASYQQGVPLPDGGVDISELRVGIGVTAW
jgi:hypothetical protein